MSKAERVRALLEERPMTRHALECELGIAQQRVSEALRELGAHVVGHQKPPNKGQPAPIYSMHPAHPSLSVDIPAGVSSVFQLGSRI